jgi:5-deoxy-glucuronate isomerase
VSQLLVRGEARGDSGAVVAVTPERARWRYVGFEVLRPSDPVERSTSDRETCVVVISGTCAIEAGDRAWPAVGGRDSPFAGSPDSVYVPPGAALRIVPAGPGLEVAICTAPATGALDAHRIDPASIEVEHRGNGPFAREIRPILMDADRPEAESLLVCEVITPAGHWSSFPPHKHDRDALPGESMLEETYYHRVSDPGGFGLQRVYSADRELDESIAFGDRDTVLVPRGFHVVSAPPGYDLYYLNVMAGPVRRWAITEDPAHAWIAAEGRR